MHGACHGEDAVRTVLPSGRVWRFAHQLGAPARWGALVGAAEEAVSDEKHHAAPWYVTLWLTGVDYFSSLGYAPGLAIAAAGYVAPVATVLLVLVTALAAVPVYRMVARHSSDGEGSIKMIERLTVAWGRLGWMGKVIVLVLIGFAMTDFVITITLSAADATHHVLENPLVGGLLPHSPVLVTAGLILGLCLVFLWGFREAIGVSMLIAIPYMVMNAVIVGAGLTRLAAEPAVVAAWWSKLTHFRVHHLAETLTSIDPAAAEQIDHFRGGGVGMLLLVSLVVFPKLALGMSGFETGVSVMPNVRAKDREERVHNTHLLLMSAAALMCVELLGANFVATLLIPFDQFGPGGEANGRALAWLAHELLGHGFGTVYDVNTVLILWFAGASAMAGLLNILPRYLPRFGMSPTWLERQRPLVVLLTSVCLFVNWWFSADVEAQGSAYATGVLVLMASGAFAVLLAEWQVVWRRVAFGSILAVFLYVLVVNTWERPDGLKIGGAFIAITMAASLWSRYLRASELRIPSMVFDSPESEALWKDVKEWDDVVLIPIRSATRDHRTACAARKVQHQATPTSRYVFLHVELVDDTSRFESAVRVKAVKDGDDVVVEIRDAVAVANAIAYTAIELDVREVVIGLLDNGTPFMNAVMYLLFGTGEIGYGVRAIFMRLREQWIAEHEVALSKYDADRDLNERELVRDMVVLEDDERKARMDELFEQQHAKFVTNLPKLRRLPHLILFE